MTIGNELNLLDQMVRQWLTLSFAGTEVLNFSLRPVSDFAVQRYRAVLW